MSLVSEKVEGRNRFLVITVIVMAVALVGLGTWVIDITYDDSIVTAESCAPRQSTGCGIFDSNVRFNGFDGGV